jgi:hypothetical protein
LIIRDNPQHPRKSAVAPIPMSPELNLTRRPRLHNHGVLRPEEKPT